MHAYGHPADMNAIATVADRFGLWVMEDGAQAHLATYHDAPVGGLSRGAAFSFFANKIITTGEGGAVTVDDDDLAETVRALRHHGVARATTVTARRSPDSACAWGTSPAAVGCAQLERVDQLLTERRDAVAHYEHELRALDGISLQPVAPSVVTAPWLLSILVESGDAPNRPRRSRARAGSGAHREPQPVPPARYVAGRSRRRSRRSDRDGLGASGVEPPALRRDRRARHRPCRRHRSAEPMRRADSSASVAVTVDQDLFTSDYPIALQVEFTSHCQLRCRMCPLTTGTSSSSGSAGPMRDVVFDEVLRVARRCRSVILAGYGEPLTNPQCLPMLRALDAEGIGVAIATNGIALTSAIAVELVALRHLSLINVSIDSPDPEIYAEVRGGNVSRALQGLRNLMAVIDIPERVVVSAVAMETNLASLVAFPPLLAELGVRRFSLQAVMDYTDYAYGHRLRDHPELEPLLRAIEDACAEHDIELDLSVPDRTRDDFDAPSRRRALLRRRRVGRAIHSAVQRAVGHPLHRQGRRVFVCCFAGSANERQLGQLGAESFDEILVGRRVSSVPPGHRRRREQPPRSVAVVRSRHSESTSTRRGPRSSSPRACVGATSRRPSCRSPCSMRANRPGRPSTRSESRRPTRATDRNAAESFRVALAEPPHDDARTLGTSGRDGNIRLRRLHIHGRGHTTAFELVADGTCWLPNTRFAVTVPGSSRSRYLELLRRLARRSRARSVRRRLLQRASERSRCSHGAPCYAQRK